MIGRVDRIFEILEPWSKMDDLLSQESTRKFPVSNSKPKSSDFGAKIMMMDP
jgi:hypothetical protein